ncbi:MAG: hypothetical protein J6J36_05355 [Clostridia bacterium]|nr:hypothetical protein [Clostridia bacterium]
MRIEGGNIEEEGELKSLSEHWKEESEEQQKLIYAIEEMYSKFKKEANKVPVKPMSLKDGLVEIKGGMLNHKCTNNIELLECIAKEGILASEWFGIRESEMEGAFCAFLSRMNTEEQDKYPIMFSEHRNRGRLRGDNGSVLLFFDETNPAVEHLIHMDYFEYEKKKAESPETLKDEYTTEEIAIFDHLIEPDSPNGKDFHINNKPPYCNWSAIPGGIPSSLVNGICTGRREYDEEYINKLSKLFPNATIFNNSREVIHMPQIDNRGIKIDEEHSKMTTRDIANLTGVVAKDEVDKANEIINQELNRNGNREVEQEDRS